MTDRELADRCIRGDRSAHELLWKMYAGKMFTVCRRYFAHNEDAQDALQEGFIRVFRYLDQWQEQGQLGAWIRRVMVNTSLNILKNKKTIVVGIESEFVTELTDHSIQALSDLHEEDLIRLIQQMPAGYRTVFNLFAVEGFSHAEIASSLNVSENTSKTQYHKAKAWLKSKLELSATHG
jgi:RNA polymerase sigma-70 factor (ECF subfamily)